MTETRGKQTAAQVLEATGAPGDEGAETADRFEWQAQMATADVLSLYFACLNDDGTFNDVPERKLICEHHEDWAIARGDDAEIVSGKHREASSSPISSYRQWLLENGALHLYRRWVALQRLPHCRLVTSAGLSGDAAKTERVCARLRADATADDQEIGEVLDALTGLMATLLPDGENLDPGAPDGDVRAFLTSFSFQVAQPRRTELPELAGERYGRPIAERLGAPMAGSAVWTAVHALVSPRMRAAGPRIGGALPTVLGEARKRVNRHDNADCKVFELC